MDKCVCHINGYAIKDATARKEIENLKINEDKVNTFQTQLNSQTARLEYFVGEVSKVKSDFEELRETADLKKVAFLSHSPFVTHNGATMFFCATTPYHDIEIVGGSFWYEYSHYNLITPVKLIENSSNYLYFEYQEGSICLEVSNLICVKRNNVYYWTSQTISVIGPNGMYTDVNMFGGQNCTLLLKCSEA